MIDNKIIIFAINICAFLLFSKPVFATTQITNITATASNSYAGFPPANVLDNNPATLWNSGNNGSQWIMLDLQSPQTINQLQLVVSQSPNGRTIHQIEAGPTSTSLTTIFKLDQIVADNETITIPLLFPATNVRYVKISAQGSTSWVSWRDIKVFSGDTPVSNNLKYYGYLSYDGLINDLGATYLSELAELGNTNITWGSYIHAPVLAARGIKLINTDLRFVFFDSNGRLNSDWQARFNDIKPKLTPHLSSIYSFYFDEPAWNNISADDFRTATRAIRQAFPNTGIMVLEAAPPLRSNSIPAGYYEYVTDLGFDYYFTNDTSDNLAGWGEYLKLHENLKPHLVGKKLWLVPDGYGNNYARWHNSYERYLSLAITSNNAVGIIGFIYQWPTPGPTLRSMLFPGQPQYDPNFRARQIEVGKAIIKNYSPIPPTLSPAPSPSPKPGDLNNDHKVDLFDFNLLISKFGNPYTIFDFNAIVSNYGK